jgi:hypothetical protein
MKNKYICPLCKTNKTNLGSLINHVDNTHLETINLLKENSISTKQYLFNIKNKKNPLNKFGRSIISSKETEWNELSGKYNRILENEKEAYRKMFSERMMKIHKTDNLLNIPEQQKKMLANRKISGRYLYDGKELTYTGTYELDFLEYMNHVLKWPVEDLELPAKESLIYKDPREKDRERFYMPDAYIISLDLLIEIKPLIDFHYKARDSDLEAAKDEAANQSNHNYIKVYDKDYTDLTLKIKELSENLKD